ncbi:LLM class flavin-dependent oxidoreductase [Novosphingobium sp. AP12]|uniref:LLM class flavin-dependent oxidoreductase n=1 Tax=Novosphingobium sp. AP12 TaxID=1144305 RepID=UPI000271FFB6|nr:LLM class flavin-dependent oxidoreductase [Novosphingobium sp. AP12]EJL34210.1 flavin-dependent oxidoreductase, methylene-tetrahydromethanopterin reductase [Novosphingobium sp. AP12]
MSIEIIGTFNHRESSEAKPRPMGVIELDFIARMAAAFEAADFDRVLIAQAATWPDGLVFATHLAGITARLKFMIAHRPGFIAPTMAARMFATLDRVSQGRVGVHIISAPSDIETQADGDFLTRDERHARSAEYIPLLRRTWSGETFDHDGAHYRLRNAHSQVTPVQVGGIPIFFGGQSPLALGVAGQHADVYAFGVDRLEPSAALIDAVRGHARAAGRRLDFCMSTRIIVGRTEGEAWDKAEAVLEAVRQDVLETEKQGGQPGALGKNHLAEARARDGDVLDERLWVGIARATGFQKAASTIVGTPDTVVASLMRYYDLGVTRFLISGFDPMQDLCDFGNDLVPRLRALASGRQRHRVP